MNDCYVISIKKTLRFKKLAFHIICLMTIRWASGVGSWESDILIIVEKLLR
jgi:hypothetical protein